MNLNKPSYHHCSALFAYGTLLVPEIFLAVTDERRDGIEATLDNFAIYQVAAREYPGIILENGHVVQGKVFQNVNRKMFARLDEYEGALYERLLVEVMTIDNQKIPAYAYIIPEARKDILTRKPWSLDKFIHSGLRRFAEKHGIALKRPEL